MAKQEDIPTKYEHGILRNIPLINKIPEVQETREQARARRTQERLERLDEVKTRTLEESFEQKVNQDRAKALQEEAKAQRMRG